MTLLLRIQSMRLRFSAVVHNEPMHHEHSDAVLVDLIDQIARGDAAALKRLYDRVSGRLFGLALRVVSRQEMAEDALQEAFLSIWNSASDYRASLSPPLAWLGLIVRSRALDQLRRHQAQRSDQSIVLDEDLSETLPSDEPNPMDRTDTSQQASALHGCLQQLEPKQRQVMSLAYLRDLSHAELAAQLKIPLGTVKTWIRRGLAQLRGCMARFN